LTSLNGRFFILIVRNDTPSTHTRPAISGGNGTCGCARIYWAAGGRLQRKSAHRGSLEAASI
jgi:hypothetical protein